jgi:hypothetical protein
MRLHCIVLLWFVMLTAPRGVGAQQLLVPPPVEGAGSDAYSSAWSLPEAAPTSSGASQPAPNPATETLPTPANAALGDVAAEAETAGDGVFEERQKWYERAFLLVPAPWDTGVELGLNGSAGTNDSFSLRTGGYIKRSSRFSKLDLSTYYNRTGSGGDVTQNNAQFDFRNDWLLDETSPWTLFATNTVFYDQFKDFDLQTNADLGVGYRIFHEPGLEFITRVGGGTSREFGGPDDRWVPESLFGFEYSQQLNATQKFYGKLDYFPEWDQVGEFRLVADTGWEVVLVQPSNLSLKISATDRYDSTPNGASPHLINYSVLLLLKL